MKVSIAWAFDHVRGTWQSCDVPALIARMSSTIGEIDGFEHILIDKTRFSLAQVESCGAEETIVRLSDRKKTVRLPVRSDAGEPGFFLVCATDDGGFRWAQIADLGGSRKELIAPLSVAQEDVESGAWRDQIEHEDWVFEIDNKAVTHRPDLWGHRGFGREISAMLGLTCASEEQICTQWPIHHYDKKAPNVDLSASSACTRFATVEVTGVAYAPSFLRMVSRMARIDARALNALVDIGNYVMFDIGHPMHVFDAQRIQGGTLIARLARQGEKLQLIDGESVALTSEDTVIADATGPLSLAGIMGGRESGVERSTTRIFLEAAHFDATAIRKTATRFKKRTESSTRFEKSLDPNQNTLALNRYLSLLEEFGISRCSGVSIVSVGALVQEGEIVLSHKFLIDRVGTAITEGQVRAILTRLGFGVQTIDGVHGLSYRVEIPTFRATKDIKIAEDLVEEVVRYYGYETIVPLLPSRQMRPFNTNLVMRKRRLKRACAYGLLMREVDTYPFFDESWLREIAYEPLKAVPVVNPVSENWRRLVTTLIPHLLQTVFLNAIREDELRFFEVARRWHDIGIDGFAEQHVCSGVFYKKEGCSFFDGKAYLTSLFDALDVLVDWSRPQRDNVPSWASEFEVAALMLDQKVIGYAGMVHPALAGRVAPGQIFAFEFETLPLLEKRGDDRTYMPISRYQEVVLDVSVLVGRRVTVAALENAIALADARIRDVALMDVFEKEEWGDRRSITMRYVVQDDDKTLVRQEIDEVQMAVHGAVKSLGAEIR